MSNCKCNTEKKEETKGNVWLSRLGFIILIIGMFPEVAELFPDKTYFIIKWVIIFSIVAYGINLLKYFVKSFF